MDRAPMKVFISGPCWAESPRVSLSTSPRHLELRPPPGLHPALDGGWSSCASTPCSDAASTYAPEDPRGGRDSLSDLDASLSPVRSRGLPAGFWGQSLEEQPQPEASESEQRTTLHIRNLPCSFKRHDLLGLINSWGLAGQYDFAYLPLDFRTRRSLGYAFVNFKNSAAAQICKGAMHGFTQWSGRSRKACSVEWSQTQGYEANVKVIQKSKVMKLCSEFKPVVFENGAMVPCPA